MYYCRTARSFGRGGWGGARLQRACGPSRARVRVCACVYCVCVPTRTHTASCRALRSSVGSGPRNVCVWPPDKCGSASPSCIQTNVPLRSTSSIPKGSCTSARVASKHMRARACVWPPGPAAQPHTYIYIYIYIYICIYIYIYNIRKEYIYIYIYIFI